MAQYAVVVFAGALTVWLIVVFINRSVGYHAFQELAIRLEKVVPQETNAEKEVEKEAEKETEKEAGKEETASESEKAEPASNDAATTDPQQSVLDEQVAHITGRSVFVAIKPKKLSAKLVGVLGEEAIFAGNKYAKVGGNIDGAKVKALGPDWVDLEWEGKTIKQWVFGPRKLASGPEKGGEKKQPEESGNTFRSLKIPENFQPSTRLLDRLNEATPDVSEAFFERIPPQLAEQIKEHL